MATEKPKKPYPGFPLFPHATGQWAKKIRGKMHYFGAWDDWEAASKRYDQEREALHAGRAVRRQRDVVTVGELCNRFADTKRLLRDAGNIKPRTYDDYVRVCDLVVKSFGESRPVDDLHPEDFQALRAKFPWGVHRTKLAVQTVRSLFRYGHDEGMYDRLVRFGQGFAGPSARQMRTARHAKPPRMYEPEQIRAMIEAARPTLRAMILLGINCGFGCEDCASLPFHALDLARGWHTHARPKTGVARRGWLWPETVTAIRKAIEHRPAQATPDAADRVFLTAYGKPWNAGPVNPISKETTKLAIQLGISLGGFYGLRHTFETVGGESLDQIAVDAIMGHAPASSDMRAVYRERITNERLQAVAEHVRAWLFPSAPQLPTQRRIRIRKHVSTREPSAPSVPNPSPRRSRRS